MRASAPGALPRLSEHRPRRRLRCPGAAPRSPPRSCRGGAPRIFFGAYSWPRPHDVAQSIGNHSLADLDAEEDSEPVETPKAAGFRERSARCTRTRPTCTVHHYGDLSGTRKIDYVMCDSRWRVVEAAIVREKAADVIRPSTSRWLPISRAVRS